MQTILYWVAIFEISLHLPSYFIHLFLVLLTLKLFTKVNESKSLMPCYPWFMVFMKGITPLKLAACTNYYQNLVFMDVNDIRVISQTSGSLGYVVPVVLSFCWVKIATF